MEVTFKINDMKCIYLRTNLINGKQYVGQTNDFKNRECSWNCLTSSYGGSLINRAREKYGLDNWTVEILRECNTQDELNEWEMYYINKLNTKKPNGYNLNDGGKGQSGFHHSEESRRKMSSSQMGIRKGIPRTEDVKKKISKAMKGRKVSSGMTGHKHSEESKKKMSVNRKGIPSTHKTTVYQYKNGELVAVYSSITEAAKSTGYGLSSIAYAVNGNLNKEGNHKLKGYEWFKGIL